jgi:hypothetical protein
LRNFARSTAARAGIVMTLSLVCGFLAAAGNSWYAERDFECFHVAGGVAASGGDPYDPAQYQAATSANRPAAEALAACGPRFPWPPWTTLVFAALATLSLPLASTVWISLLVAATVLGIGWTWQLAGPGRVPWPVVAVLVILTEPFVLALLHGQFGPFFLALTAGAGLWLRSRHGVRAGLAMAGLALKPHTAFVSGPLLLAIALRSRQWNAVATAGALFAVALVVSIALRPSWLAAWLLALDENRAIPVFRNTTWDLARSLGSSMFAVVIIGLVLAAVVALVRARPLAHSDLVAFGAAFSMVVTPHAWAHDFMVLAIPWTVTLAHAKDLRPAVRRALTYSTLFVAAPLFWTFQIFIQVVRTDESLSALIPILTTLLLALAIHIASPSATIRKTPEVT